ncbi:MAG: citrate/2-methylcitrate synthase [Nitrospira sp.]
MPHDFMPGLAGVPAAKSAISDVDGLRGVLEYRGIRVEELCQHSSFLETSYLLLFGRLPTAKELTQWVDDVTHHRRIKFRIVDLLKVMPEHGHPMDALQAAVAALGMFYPGRNVKDVENNYWSAVRLIAKLPTIVAAWATAATRRRIHPSSRRSALCRQLSLHADGNRSASAVERGLR